MLCKNPKCRAVLGSYQWGDGYCSKECMAAGVRNGERISDSLHDRSANLVTLSFVEDEMYALEDAAAIDPRLPRIIFLRRAGRSYRHIGKKIGETHMECYRLLHSVTPNLLRRCGLRKF